MTPIFHRALEPVQTHPPRLRPNWTTWMWLGLALAVLVALGFGLWFAAQPYAIH